MAPPSVVVEGVSKSYRLRGSARVSDELGSGRSQRDRAESTFWALRDVSFEAQPGEVIGIIGHNGSGKSTLLKVLSRVTAPTTGRVTLRGRISSLLEVGTGFHPDLSGRENIYLNSAILGVTRQETRRNFDSIVAFAGVERFLDTPLKHYSSGQQLRLGFAVAAHLEPEVFIIDEGFAVGDVVFQRKSQARLSELAQNGRTVFVVSHNMAAIERMCSRALLMHEGTIIADASPAGVLKSYWDLMSNDRPGSDIASMPRASSFEPVFTAIEFFDSAGIPTKSVGVREPLVIRLSYAARVPLEDPAFSVLFRSMAGRNIIYLQTRVQLGTLCASAQRGVITCTIPSLPLVAGNYAVQIGCSASGTPVDLLAHAANLAVIPRDVYGTGLLPPSLKAEVVVDASWRLEEAPAVDLDLAVGSD